MYHPNHLSILSTLLIKFHVFASISCFANVLRLFYVFQVSERYKCYKCINANASGFQSGARFELMSNEIRTTEENCSNEEQAERERERKPPQEKVHEYFHVNNHMQ